MLRSRSLMVSRDAGLVWYLWLVFVVVGVVVVVAAVQ